MTDISIKYTFEENAEIIEKRSSELREYEISFEEQVLPKIKEVEKRKAEAVERAYRISISLHNRSKT